MRILHVTDTLDPAAGGPVEGIRQMVGALRKVGQEFEIVSMDAPGSESCLARIDVPVHELGPSRGTYCHNAKLVPWLRANAPRFDVVIAHGIWQYPSLAVWRALHRSSTPYFIYPHGMLDPWFKRAYPLKHLKKWFYWTWGAYPVLRDARATLFTSEEERIQARESFWLYKCNEVVVDYGTAGSSDSPDAELASFYELLPELRGKRLLLYLSRINAKKGCDLLIDAFAGTLASNPDWHLLLAGPDQFNYKANLIARARRHGISEQMTWPGMLTGRAKWGAFRAAEAFALPSHQENFGVVVAEALSCGTPVLISNKVNIWREIKDAGAGLVANDDLEGTVQLLTAWSSIPEPEKLVMRRNARACFEQRFEINRAGKRLLEVLEDLAGDTRSSREQR